MLNAKGKAALAAAKQTVIASASRLAVWNGKAWHDGAPRRGPDMDVVHTRCIAAYKRACRERGDTYREPTRGRFVRGRYRLEAKGRTLAEFTVLPRSRVSMCAPEKPRVLRVSHEAADMAIALAGGRYVGDWLEDLIAREARREGLL